MNPARIRRLSRDLVNKIAAGEVVERPASVVKELVENAIDAESSRVEVFLEDGGKKLIRVVDDGVGMSPEDLELAFESHATSKLAGPDDLFAVHTLGFRGEALASIGAVGRCRIVSRRRGSEEGASIERAAGVVGEARKCGAPEGTIVEVRDLFFNTPARLKFLRSTATELRHATEAIARLALPYPSLAVNLVHGKRPVLRLPRCGSPRERAVGVMGESFCERLLAVHSETAAMSVTGFVSPPGEGMARPTQYVFLNGRYIRDRAIHRAIAEAYRSRLMRGRHPGVILHLQIDPARVDVNVHPTKVEVRFRDSGAVFAQVLTAVEKALRTAAPATPGRTPPIAPRDASSRRESVRRAIGEFFEQRASGIGAPGPPPLTRKAPPPPKPAEAVDGTRAPELAAPASPPDLSARRPKPRVFCQIHDSYIVEQTEDGFLVIDQHALHERILYDELRARVRAGSVPRQRLLVPEIVDLSAEDFLWVTETKGPLVKMGIEVEPFGEKTVAVHAVPHLADKVNPRDLLLNILSEVREGVADRPGDREEMLLRVIACKAAVKAGDRLGREQVEALLEQRDRIGPEPTCPHGRPTTLRFERDDLEKQFRRK